MSEEGQNIPVDNVPMEAVKLISPYIKRGKELANVQPLISYYCYLYAAQLILESQLHLKYEDIASYIEILLNAIEEQRKDIEESTNTFTEILTDKEKSFKLVLGFSLSIFNKCVNEIENHNVTKKTVQNFTAFLNFIEVIKLWPDFYNVQEGEIRKQIRYAKFHLGRILKAFKSNTDPNDYITENHERELDQLMDGSVNNVEDNNEGEDKIDGTILDNVEDKVDEPNDSSLALPETPAELPGELKLPVAPVLIKGQKNSLGLPSAPESSKAENDIITKPISTPTQPAPTVPTIPKLPPKPQSFTTSNNVNVIEPPSNGRILTRHEVEKIWDKEEIISNAQRKAKFAISALNYSDIQTAINELESALSLLNNVKE